LFQELSSPYKLAAGINQHSHAREEMFITCTQKVSVFGGIIAFYHGLS